MVDDMGFREQLDLGLNSQTNKLQALLSEFPVTELVCQCKGKLLLAKIDTAALPKVLSVSTTWRAFWHPQANTYYVYFERKRKRTYLHRVVSDAPGGYEVDHRFHNGLDNRASEIRVVGRSENVRNTRINRNKHGYRGIRWYAPHQKWAAQARVNGTLKHLGYFATKEEAAAAYQKFFDERMSSAPPPEPSPNSEVTP